MYVVQAAEKLFILVHIKYNCSLVVMPAINNVRFKLTKQTKVRHSDFLDSQCSTEKLNWKDE